MTDKPQDTMPEFVTKEEIIQLISQTVNSAISQRNSSFEKKIEALLTKPQETTEEVKPGRVPNAEIAAMKKQLDEMRAEKESEINKRRDTELRTSLRDHLTKAGVAPHLIKAAVATLLVEDKAVGYTSDEYAADKNKVVFKTQNGEEELTSGLAKWIRSEEGSSFLAPRGAQGSGGKSLNNNTLQKDSKPTNDGLVELLFQHRNS